MFQSLYLCNSLFSYGLAGIHNFEKTSLNALSTGSLAGAMFYDEGHNNIFSSLQVMAGGFIADLADSYANKKQLLTGKYFTNIGLGSMIGYKLTSPFDWAKGNNYELASATVLGGALGGIAAALGYSAIDSVRAPAKNISSLYKDMNYITYENKEISTNIQEMSMFLLLSSIFWTSGSEIVSGIIKNSNSPQMVPILMYIPFFRDLFTLYSNHQISSLYVAEIKQDIKLAILENVFSKEESLKLAEMRHLDPTIQELYLHVDVVSQGLAKKFQEIIPMIATGLTGLTVSHNLKYTSFIADAFLDPLLQRIQSQLKVEKGKNAQTKAEINHHMLDATHNLRSIIELDGIERFVKDIDQKSYEWQKQMECTDQQKVGLLLMPLPYLLMNLFCGAFSYSYLLTNDGGGNLSIQEIQHIVQDMMSFGVLNQMFSLAKVQECDYSESMRLLKELVSELKKVQVNHDVLYSYQKKFDGLAIKDLEVRLNDQLLSKINNLYITKESGSGKIIAITGDSGCGKSTMFSVIKGLSVIGNDIKAAGKIAYGSHNGEAKVKMITQSDYLPRSSTLAEVINYPDPVNEENKEKFVAILEQMDDPSVARTEGGMLSERLNEFHESWNDKISGGQKKKIKITKALSDDSDIILIDEGLTGLDALSQKRVMTAIKEYAHDKIVLIIDHEAKSHQQMMANKFYDGYLHFSKGGEAKMLDHNGQDVTYQYSVPEDIVTDMTNGLFIGEEVVL